MTNRPATRTGLANAASTLSPRSRTTPVKSHTHLQRVASGIPVDRGGEVMALDRGTLAKIDRSILSELDQGEGVHLVKVPLSDAVWSTWRRYCDAVRLTMGEGIAGVIAHELGMLVSDDEHHGVVFAAELQRRLVARSEALDVRERCLDERERSLKSSERLLRARTRPLELPGGTSVGRNDPCPCGSGFKYKRCHGN